MALITKQEAAQRLNRAPSAVTKLVQDKELRTYTLPGKKREMVDENDVEKIRARVQQGTKFTPLAHRKLSKIEPNSSAPPESQESRPPPPQKKVSEITEDDFSLFNEEGKPDSMAIRAWGEYEEARIKNIKRLALEGEYVLAAEVGPRFERAMLTIQKGVLATTSRLQALHTEIPQPVIDSLDELLREALEKAVDNSINGN